MAAGAPAIVVAESGELRGAIDKLLDFQSGEVVAILIVGALLMTMWRAPEIIRALRGGADTGEVEFRNALLKHSGAVEANLTVLAGTSEKMEQCLDRLMEHEAAERPVLDLMVQTLDCIKSELRRMG